tara:strand:- start:10294 stop:10458 length:165 start_codon:yes stop_codon:yes gene_type:complete
MKNTQKEFLAREIKNTLKNKEHWIAKYGKDDEEIKYFDELLESLNTELANAVIK